MLDTCNACGGFVPESVDACPNCSQDYLRRNNVSTRRAVGGAVACGALAMTLMACYGAPFDDGASCEYAPELSTQVVAISSGELSESPVAPSCGEANERSYTFEPPSNDSAGLLTVSWTSSEPTTVAFHRCSQESGEEACVAPTTSGMQELELSAYTSVLVTFHGLSEAAASSGQVSATFVPYCGDGTLQPNFEECEDGNRLDGDGCSSTCRTEIDEEPEREPTPGGIGSEL